MGFPIPEDLYYFGATQRAPCLGNTHVNRAMSAPSHGPRKGVGACSEQKYLLPVAMDSPTSFGSLGVGKGLGSSATEAHSPTPDVTQGAVSGLGFRAQGFRSSEFSTCYPNPIYPKASLLTALQYAGQSDFAPMRTS